MIRINLLGEKKDMTAQLVVEGGGFVGAIVMSIFILFFVYDAASSHARDLEAEKDQLQRQLTQLKAQTKEVKELEEKRMLLREKLMTIAKLKANKHGPVHILAAINESIPERAWLTEMKESDGALSMTGVAFDLQTVSAFMARLEKSAYIKSVDLDHANQVIIDDVKLSQFSLVAKLQDLLELNKNNGEHKAEPAAKPGEKIPGKTKIKK